MMSDGDYHTPDGPAWVVYALVMKLTGEVLMEFRGNDIGFVYPGGNIKLGETPEETAARECLEEIGVRGRGWTRVDGTPPLMHKGRPGELFVAMDWAGNVPSLTMDEHARTLRWLHPFSFADVQPEHAGGFQVGSVARRLLDWMEDP